MVNVSIDINKEADIDVSSIGEDHPEGHWIVIDNNSSTDLNKVKDQSRFKPAAKKQNFIGSEGNMSGNSTKQRFDKYKKIA